jgi:hypothetical protein
VVIVTDSCDVREEDGRRGCFMHRERIRPKTLKPRMNTDETQIKNEP